jgi:hypothetical protein
MQVAALTSHQLERETGLTVVELTTLEALIYNSTHIFIDHEQKQTSYTAQVEFL